MLFIFYFCFPIRMKWKRKEIFGNMRNLIRLRYARGQVLFSIKNSKKLGHMHRRWRRLHRKVYAPLVFDFHLDGLNIRRVANFLFRNLLRSCCRIFRASFKCKSIFILPVRTLIKDPKYIFHARMISQKFNYY